MRQFCVLLHAAGVNPIVADPDDDKFVETALVGNATVIVSGDRHLLEQGTIEGISIHSPRRFLEQLAGEV